MDAPSVCRAGAFPCVERVGPQPLREIERTKIECARKFFDEVNQGINADKVKYDVVTDYAKLMDLVSCSNRGSI
jgi:restriction endonuclease